MIEQKGTTGAHPFPTMVGMSFTVPTSMSPSRVEAFVSCPLAFRFASIEKLPEPPSPHATKGSLVHRALELLFTGPPAERTRECRPRRAMPPRTGTARPLCPWPLR